jgi:predicted TIM-barrel fold metal-dependent hydrolase
VIDRDVPGFWRALELPGLADIHVHFMPKPVLDAVWRYFADATTHYGVAWPVHYRGTDDDRLARLRALGVRRFPTLLYPHKPDMAAWLNSWAAQFASSVAECAPTATFYPEPAAADYVRAALDAGARIFKVHLQVGAFDPRDPLLDPVWGMLAEAGVPVVVHCGSGPLSGEFTGPGPFAEVLAAHPRLTAVIAHMGAPEYGEFLALAERYPHVHLDTTMVGTPFMEQLAPLPPSLLPRIRDLGERIVLGSDFPNIPYAYAEQLAALQRWDLGENWLRAVCWHNGVRLLGMPPGE